MNIQKRHLIPSLGILAAALLAGCSQTPSGPVELGNSDALNPQAAKVPTITPQRFMLRGEIVLGHEVSTITPCNGKTQYWLSLPPSVSQDSQSLVRAPYESVYGEVIGEFVKPPVDGFPADYPATFKVTQMNLISAEIDGCNQAHNKTVASGTEPFWSVSVAGNTLQYRKLGEEAVDYPLTQRDITQQARVYEANGATLTLNPALCSDGMSDSIYGWTASFDAGWKTQKGCATLSADDPTQVWVGDYQGTTTLGNTTLTTTLELNPDHSATTTYTQAGEEDVIESGVWQQVNDNQVQVMMTRHQGQYLVSERLFSRNGFTLHAGSEIIGGQEYSLGPNGLSLSLMVGSQGAAMQQNGVDGSTAFNAAVDAAFKAYLGETGTE